MGNFKKLNVWNEALSLCELIYDFTSQRHLSKDFGFKDQIRRACVSIASNISEGDERRTQKESTYFFYVAIGSTAEVITQLNIARRIGYLDETTFIELENKTEKIRASLKNLIKYRYNSI